MSENSLLKLFGLRDRVALVTGSSQESDWPWRGRSVERARASY